MDSGVFEQVTNVACLPGIRRYALCMPDGHWGYGFPIGGVAAFDPDEGIISPGGVGYDVNCGMRLIRTDLTLSDVKPRLEPLMTELFRKVPAGVGSKGSVRLNRRDFDDVMREGAKWCVEHGYGWTEDLERIEERGCISYADPSNVSDRAVSAAIVNSERWAPGIIILRCRWSRTTESSTWRRRPRSGSPVTIKLWSWSTAALVDSVIKLRAIILSRSKRPCADMDHRERPAISLRPIPFA